jgi:hypothetical protein
MTLDSTIESGLRVPLEVLSGSVINDSIDSTIGLGLRVPLEVV